MATIELMPQAASRQPPASRRPAFRPWKRRRMLLRRRVRACRDPERHLRSGKVMLVVRLVLRRALRPDLPTVRLDDLLGHRQPEPRARRALVPDAVGVEERVEDLLR